MYDSQFQRFFKMGFVNVNAINRRVTVYPLQIQSHRTANQSQTEYKYVYLFIIFHQNRFSASLIIASSTHNENRIKPSPLLPKIVPGARNKSLSRNRTSTYSLADVLPSGNFAQTNIPTDFLS